MATKKKPGRHLQMSFFTPNSLWRPPPISSLPSWADAKRIAIDVETQDTDLKKLGPGIRRGGRIVGVSFAIEGGPKAYLPYGHEGGDNLPEDEVLNYLKGNLKNFSGEVVGANLQYDLDYLWQVGVVSPNVKFYRDVQVADPLINELHFSFSLENIGNRWDIVSKDDAHLKEAAAAFNIDPKAGLWQMPARHVGEYAEGDVTSPLEIYANQRKALDRDELWKVFDMESKVLPILVEMRRRGVRIDMEKLAEVEEWALQEEKKCAQKIKDEVGIDIGIDNVMKTGVLAPALEASGVKLGKTPQGQPQIDKEVLEGLSKTNKVAAAIAWARKVNKLRTTFAASIHKYAVNGRIHCTFNQIARETEGGDQKGARYGRLSAIDPNLQQQPSRDEFASFWRSIYVPEEGAIWGCLDFSQQEPRWTTHFAALIGLPKAEQAASLYRNDLTTDNHTMMTRLIHGDAAVDAATKEVFKKWRTDSKIVFLGLCYGEGGAKLCDDLGLPKRHSLSYGPYKDRTVLYFKSYWEAMNAKVDLGGKGWVKEVAGEEGQEIIDQFVREVPYVPELAKRVSNTAKERGYIKTVMGRRLHFPLKDDGTYDWAHKALNRLIQGSSADQTKYALVQLHEAGYFIQLQVHDEMDGSFSSVTQAQEAGKLMAECVNDLTETRLPFLVDVECGDSWGNIK